MSPLEAEVKKSNGFLPKHLLLKHNFRMGQILAGKAQDLLASLGVLGVFFRQSFNQSIIRKVVQI